MFKETIEYITQKIVELNLFEKVYSLVEIVNDADGKSFPAVYSGNGKYSIIQYSFNNGTAYIRKNGTMRINELDIDSYVGCKTYYQVSIPLNLVVFKKKSKLPLDCSLTEDVLGETILFHLTNNVKDYKATINAQRFKINVNEINTDSASVWDEETEGIEQNDVNFDIACVKFAIDVELTIDASCLTNMCDNG